MRQRFYVSYAAFPAGLQSGIVASTGYLHCTAPIQSEWKEDTIKKISAAILSKVNEGSSIQ